MRLPQGLLDDRFDFLLCEVMKITWRKLIWWDLSYFQPLSIYFKGLFYSKTLPTHQTSWRFWIALKSLDLRDAPTPVLDHQ